MKCCVDGCKNKGRFQFPKNETMRKKWLEAVRKPKFKPKKHHGLCVNHFKEGDIPNSSIFGGYKQIKVHLSRKIVPSIFPWNTPIQQNIHNTEATKENNIAGIIKSDAFNPKFRIRNINDLNHFEDCIFVNHTLDVFSNLYSDIGLYEEVIVNSENQDCSMIYKSVKTNAIMGLKNSINEPNNLSVLAEVYKKNQNLIIQYEHNYCLVHPQNDSDIYFLTNELPKYQIEFFKDDPKGVLHLTGLESYKIFMSVFNSFNSKIQNLKYITNEETINLSLENQLFLTLCKLRKNSTDDELSCYFNVSEKAIDIIFRRWIQFMADEWSKTDMWPQKQIIEYYISEYFKYFSISTKDVFDREPQNRNIDQIQQLSSAISKRGITIKSIVTYSSDKLFKYISSQSPQSISNNIKMSDSYKTCEHNYGMSSIKCKQSLKNTIDYEMQLKMFKILLSKLYHLYAGMELQVMGVCMVLCNFK